MKGAFIQEFPGSRQPRSGSGDAALMIARLECPLLDPGPSLAQLDTMGAAGACKVDGERLLQDARGRKNAVDVPSNAYLFDEEGFTGNHDRYDDPSIAS